MYPQYERNGINLRLTQITEILNTVKDMPSCHVAGFKAERSRLINRLWKIRNK